MQTYFMSDLFYKFGFCYLFVGARRWWLLLPSNIQCTQLRLCPGQEQSLGSCSSGKNTLGGYTVSRSVPLHCFCMRVFKSLCDIFKTHGGKCLEALGAVDDAEHQNATYPNFLLKFLNGDAR